MKKIAFSLLLFLMPFQAKADSRIKDIVYFEGVRENSLVGYGLVVGLNGTGDNLRNSGFTQTSLINQLNRMGVPTTHMNNLNTRNVAAVMVTASLPAFAHPGNLMSVNVSTLGDAKSLKGGNLLATPLVGADGEVYALAQGPIVMGNTSNNQDPKTKVNPTSGAIPNGGTVEKSVGFDLNSLDEIKLALKNPDITTARMVATAINSEMQNEIAQAKDPGTVAVKVPLEFKNKVVDFLAEVEGLQIAPDSVAKIIIDEATGTVVIGESVKISKVAIAQGNLLLKVSDPERLQLFLEDDNGSPFSQDKVATLDSKATLGDLVQGLNSLGVQPQDLIAILKSIHQAGALQGTLEIR
jgi:flagellar P-ring protein precursor FlgI